MRLIFLFIMGGFAPLFAFAQYDYTSTDSTSKGLFIAQDWQKLLTTSQEALQHGTDFYALRLRRGLAYFEQKKYRLAIQEFNKAQRFFPADTASRYYLCVAHGLVGNQTEVQQIINALPDTLSKVLNKRKQLLLETGLFGIFSTFDAENKLPVVAQKENGEWTAYRGLAGGGVYVSHLAGKRLSFLHSASVFSFQNFKKVNYPAQKTVFYNDGVQVGAGTHVLVSFRHLWKVNLSAQYNHISTYTQTFDTRLARYATTEFSKGGFSLGGCVEKGYKNFDFLGGAYWNNFLGYYTLQETAGLTYYPFSNARLAVRGQFSALQNLTETNATYRVGLLYFAKITLQVHKRAWLSGSYLKGDTQHFFDMENNAIYYTADRTKQQAQGNMFFLVGKHLRFSLGYIFIERSGEQFTILRPDFMPIIPISYFAHQFVTAVGWKF
jgi:hypothetical protein